MNFESQPLQTHEIESMRADPEIIGRIVESYKLMLDFYGMRLVSLENGLLQRASPPRNYEGRYRNLVREYLVLEWFITSDARLRVLPRLLAQLPSSIQNPQMSVRDGTGKTQLWVSSARSKRAE